MNSKSAASSKRAALPRLFSYSKAFLKDYERYNRAARSDMARLKALMLLLIANDGPLDPEWQDHALEGTWKDAAIRDAHVHGDFLLLYRVAGKPETIVFERIGTHSELFG